MTEVGWSGENARWVVTTVRSDIDAAEARLTARIDKMDGRLRTVERSVWAGLAAVSVALVVFGWFVRPIMEAAAQLILAGV